MSVVVFFVLALAALIYAASPLLWERFWPAFDKSLVIEIQREKKEGIWAISDVDSEYEMGKLTDHDYTALRAHLKEDLIKVMQKEKALLKNTEHQAIASVAPVFKRKLLSEVLRICGTKD